MADPLATPDDLAGYWRPLTDQETDVAASLLAVSSALIRRRVPDVDAQIAAGTLDAAIVTYVASEMVRAAVEATSRPVDAKSVSETVGPFSTSVTYEAASRLAVTDDLAALLLDETPTALGSARLGAAQAPSLPDWQSCYRPAGWMPARPGWRSA